MNVFSLKEDKNSFKVSYLIPYVVKLVYENDNFDLYNVDDINFFDNYDFIYEIDLFLSVYRKEIIKLKNDGVSLLFAVDEINNMIESDILYKKEKECILKKFLLYEGISLEEYVKTLFLKEFNSDDFLSEYNKILSLYGRILADEFNSLKEKYISFFSDDFYNLKNKNIVKKRR